LLGPPHKEFLEDKIIELGSSSKIHHQTYTNPSKVSGLESKDEPPTNPNIRSKGELPTAFLKFKFQE